MVIDKELYSVDETLRANGGIIPLSESCVYKLIRQKAIPGKRIGKRVFIPGSYLKTLTIS